MAILLDNLHAGMLLALQSILILDISTSSRSALPSIRDHISSIYKRVLGTLIRFEGRNYKSLFLMQKTPTKLSEPMTVD